jgi:hypothetical protein
MLLQLLPAERNKKPRRRSVAKDSRVHRLPITGGGTYLYHRYHVDPRLADFLAQCAGIGPQEAR